MRGVCVEGKVVDVILEYGFVGVGIFVICDGGIDGGLVGIVGEDGDIGGIVVGLVGVVCWEEGVEFGLFDIFGGDEGLFLCVVGVNGEECVRGVGLFIVIVFFD